MKYIGVISVLLMFALVILVARMIFKGPKCTRCKVASIAHHTSLHYVWKCPKCGVKTRIPRHYDG